MARETKQERTVRAMFDNVSEHLHQFKLITSNPGAKEADVEVWCQSVLRACLGFSASSGYMIRAQETRGKMRPDLIVSKGDQPVLVVEVKKLGFDLDKSEFRSGKTQLAQYLSTIGNVKWGILCNGYEWRLYDFSDLTTGGVEILSFDLRSDTDEIDTGKRAIDDTCWELLDYHESTFASGTWFDFSKEATAFSPESLARAILSADVVKLLARVIRGEHEYKANVEVLTDRIYKLLANGLDDSITGWNETKQAELHKYIKGQKRSGRRKKRAQTKSDVGTEVEVSLSSTPESYEDPSKKAA